MARRFPLQAPLDYSRHRLEAAERLLRMLKRKEEAARKRLEELVSYKREYQQRLTGTAGQGMDIHVLRDFHVFLAKLDEAIRHQEGELAQARNHWQAAHDNWLALRQKVKAYEALSTRHHAQVVRQEEQREQRSSDEMASGKYIRGSGKTII